MTGNRAGGSALIVGALLSSMALSGCAGFTERQYARSASDACAASGYPVDHPQHAECQQNTVVVLKQRDAAAEQQSNLVAAEAAAIAIGAYGAAQMYRPVTVVAPQGSATASTTFRPVLIRQYQVDRRWHCVYGNGQTVIMPALGMCATELAR